MAAFWIRHDHGDPSKCCHVIHHVQLVLTDTMKEHFQGENAPLNSVRSSYFLAWVAVKELKLSYHNHVILFLTICPYSGN